MARLASTGVAELADNVLWLIERRLQVLEEVALDPEGSATGGIQRRGSLRALMPGHWSRLTVKPKTKSSWTSSEPG